MSLKKLNETHRRVYDGSAPAGNLIAELPTSRYTIDTKDGLHNIYDTKPTEGETHPLGDTAHHPLDEQEKHDRAAVNDAALSMPARLAAMNRLNLQKRKI